MITFNNKRTKFVTYFNKYYSLQIVIINSVPIPGSLFTIISPLCFSIIFAEIAKPSPVPTAYSFCCISGCKNFINFRFFNAFSGVFYTHSQSFRYIWCCNCYSSAPLNCLGKRSPKYWWKLDLAYSDSILLKVFRHSFLQH